MDGYDAFEKALAAKKQEGGCEDEQHRNRRHKHRHRHLDSDKDRDGDGERSRDGRRDHDCHRERDRDRDRDHHHRHRPRRHYDGDGDGEGENEDEHRKKRSRHSREEEHGDDGHDQHHRSRRGHRHRDDDPGRDGKDEHSQEEKYRKRGDPKEDLPIPDEEVPQQEGRPLVRDSWMTAPSGIEIDYVQRRGKQDNDKPAATRPAEPERRSRYELRMEPGSRIGDFPPAERVVDYTIGDAGSQWRMTKLKAVYTTARETGRSVEEAAVDKYGSLGAFDEAREEKDELERRKIYGDGWVGKEKPTGELHRERTREEEEAKKKGRNARDEPPGQGVVIPDEPAAAPPAVDGTTLNVLRARLMKAKLRRAPEVARLEEEYDKAVVALASGASSAQAPPNAVVLGAMDSRQLAGERGEVRAVETRRGRERGLVEDNDEMTVGDMVREERRTKGQAGGEGLRLAERIAKDAKFDGSLEYMDENAERLARRLHKSDINLKNVAASEYQKLSRILDTCPLCHRDDETPPRPPAAPVVSLATRTFLTLPPEPELSPLGAVIVPLAHRTNLIECDDDEWEEMRNFMKSLTRMYHDLGRDVVFYENAASPRRRRHAAMVAVSIPYDEGATAPAFFREAMLSADEEWTQHRKVIDTAKLAREGGAAGGRMAFRKSIAKEMPYFHAWFSVDGGLGHVVEDEARWPRGDLFAREVLGGMMDVDVATVKKEGRWRRGETGGRVDEFQRRWRRFDWTRVLADGS